MALVSSNTKMSVPVSLSCTHTHARVQAVVVRAPCFREVEPGAMLENCNI